MDVALFYAGVALAGIIPVDVGLTWFYQWTRHVYKKLDRPKSYLYFSKSILIQALVWGVQFLKGFLVPYLAVLYFDEGIELIVGTIMLLILHNWSPLLGFKNRRSLLLPLLGVYTFMSGSFLGLAPLLFIALSLLLNSFVVGILLSVVGMFVAIWFLTVSPIFIPINFVAFLVVFVVYGRELFAHFEKTPQTILRAFEAR